ncbi:Replication initiation and membrane attachment protein DnaB [Lactiplantibacillus plantarum]|uniref:replication initiation and membrane attachment family protein n=1 Tax=Lactiplantibacillus plantarum TaxID=1590 RepID=UPI0018EA4DE6|nr:DnaD domain protein [Lactiplantibacillus plantarum]MCG0590840.1 Replication initiation and membrane attachment protein DnaB [Lactiplantibacillus plantarum]MCG0669647.1 Replication initiation and membrane attachment protein DnaB [Lactiplantibacillus plantarum]MCG0918746.1 Replication initiation and membrane attachment protein DnaB [Lactiplantibacillus plantarum]UNF75581.1 DnaD domain protein [Lactiplantibacillus plantarum]
MPNDEPLTPKTGLVVPQAPALSAAQQAVLAELYLPLMGPLAYSLYAALRSLQSSENELSNRRSHAELLGILNVDLPTVLAARRKLEATGLLRSYYQQDELGAMYIYQLQAPLLALQFFADDLLSVLLLDTVGELRYQQLAGDFAAQPIDLTAAKDVTANILDVFHVDSQKVTTPPLSVQKVRAQLAANEPAEDHSPVLSDDDFDWQLLGQILKQNYVDLKQVASSRQLIITESRVYGISEIEMAKLISEVASLTTGQFDENQLKLLIARRYERPAVSSQQVATEATVATVATTTTKDNKASAQLSTAEQQLVTYAKQTAPYDFLSALKQEKHGFVTSGENRLVHDLIGRGVLPNAVINMVIYYLLQNRELAALNRNLLETVANDWQQHGITTPEAALMHLKQRKQPKSTPTRRKNNRPTRKEIMPKWAQQQQQTESGKQPAQTGKQITAAQRKQLADRLAKLETNSEKED